MATEVESNDSRQLANALGLNGSVVGRLAVATDIDYFRVTLGSSGVLSLNLDVPSNSSLAYFKLALVSATGVVLAQFTTGRDSVFRTPVQAGGDYFVAISVDDSFFFNSDPYGLSVSLTAGSTSGYEVEPDDTRQTATPLALATSITGQLATASDIDYFRVTLGSSGVVNLNLDVPSDSSLAYFKLALVSATGVMLAQFTTGRDGVFRTPVQAAGDYFIAISVDDSFFYNGNPYGLSVSLTAGSTAGYEVEPDDTRQTATPLALATSITGQLAAASDIDHFRVTLGSSGVVNMNLDVPSDSSLAYFKLALVSSTGVVLAQFTAGRDSVFRTPVQAAGDYFVAISVDDSFFYNSNPYGLSVSLTAGSTAGYEVEPDNTRQTATPLALATSITGQLATVSDIDYFKVTLGSPGVLSLNLDVPSDSSLAYFKLALVSATGAVLAQFTTGRDSVFQAPVQVGGDYYVAISVDDSFFYNSNPYRLIATLASSQQNRAPVSANGTATTSEDTVLSGALPPSTDLDGDAITYSRASDPSMGTVAVNANGSYTYRPNANVNGPDSFTFNVSDGKGGRNTYTQTITITAVNDPPVSANGSTTISEDTSLAGTLRGASDADGDPVVYALASNPGKGTAAVNADGRYTYTPNPDANGTDTFGFTVSDGKGGSNSYMQTITITSVDDAPVGSVTVSGVPQVGQTLSASNTLADVDGLGPITYQWLRDGSAIAGATSASYLLVAADGGAQIRVRASYIDGGGTLEAVTSSTVSVEVPVIVINGTPNTDSLPGSAGDDSISGQSGDDTLLGLSGNDTLRGGDGGDVLNGGSGNDSLDGGAGRDVADYRGSGAVNASLQTGTAVQGTDTDRLVGIEAIFGSSAGDVLRGLDGPANLPGETLRGGAGNDTLDGGSGIDWAEFSGPLSAYTVSRTPGGLNLVVVPNAGGANASDGTDTLANVELLLFSDRVLAFGPRVEQVARVAFALWTPPIINSPTLFAKGISFYTNEFGYSFDTLCQVALQYYPEPGAATAARLKASIPGIALTVQQLIDLMAANGGIDTVAGRAAAVKAVAHDAATTAQLELAGVANGIAASLGFPGETPDYFGPLPG